MNVSAGNWRKMRVYYITLLNVKLNYIINSDGDAATRQSFTASISAVYKNVPPARPSLLYNHTCTLKVTQRYSPVPAYRIHRTNLIINQHTTLSIMPQYKEGQKVRYKPVGGKYFPPLSRASLHISVADISIPHQALTPTPPSPPEPSSPSSPSRAAKPTATSKPARMSPDTRYALRYPTLSSTLVSCHTDKVANEVTAQIENDNTGKTSSIKEANILGEAE